MEFDKAVQEYMLLRSERTEYETEWINVHDFLLPGRGLFQDLGTPRKKELVCSKVISDIAGDALNVLATGIQGGLIPSNKPWLMATWNDPDIKKVRELVMWLDGAIKAFSKLINKSNFYSTNAVGIKELIGFGTGAIFVDGSMDDGPFSFEQVPLGEYVFTTDWRNRPNRFHRILFKSPYNILSEFPNGSIPTAIRDLVSKKDPQSFKRFVPILQSITKEQYRGKDWRSDMWVCGHPGANVTDASISGYTQSLSGDVRPLSTSGFYEFPIAIGTWENIGSDEYGVGPGIKAVREIRRLQDMEKTVRLAAHKDVDPPITAPSYLRGVLNRYPGGENFVRTYQDKISSIYDRGFNYEGISTVIDRVEMGIKLKFYNDVFLTTARDPNATPMKAAEVHVKDGERMLRLGAAIEKMIPEYFIPQIERAFNIALRKGFIEKPPEQYMDLIEGDKGEFELTFISPLAQAQKLIGVKPIQDYMVTVGNAASVKPEALYKIDIFKALDEIADAGGTPPSIVVPTEQAMQSLQRDQQAQQEQMKKQEELATAQVSSQVGLQDAQSQKARAEGGQALTEASSLRNEFGMI